MAVDVKRRAWAQPVEGAPAFYRARTFPYKGRRTRVKVYPTFPQSYAEPVVAFSPTSSVPGVNPAVFPPPP